MKLLFKGAQKSAEKELRSKLKGRPTCKKEIVDERKKPLRDNNPKYKFLNIQMEKLENMYVILTAEDGMRKLTLNLRYLILEFGKAIDEWERDFKKLRDDSRLLKNKLKERAEMIENAVQKSAQTVCNLSKF